MLGVVNGRVIMSIQQFHSMAFSKFRATSYNGGLDAVLASSLLTCVISPFSEQQSVDARYYLVCSGAGQEVSLLCFLC